MFEHVPKINAGLGCLVLLCFFLPWVSFSCGTVTFLKLSGYHLTAGKVPVDESVLKQYEQRGNSVARDERIPKSAKTSSPRYIFLIVPICALNIIAFSLRMTEGNMDRFKAIAAILFAGIGFVFLLGAGLMDFGLDLPSGSATLIQSSVEPGYFGALLAFIAAAVLPLLTLRTINVSSAPSAPVELQNAEEAPSEVVRGETFSPDVTEHFGLTPPKQPEVRPQAPPGAKTCPSCGVVVGAFQVKCLKCGSPLKASK